MKTDIAGAGCDLPIGGYFAGQEYTKEGELGLPNRTIAMDAMDLSEVNKRKERTHANTHAS